MNTVRNGLTSELIYFSSALSKKDSLINAHILESKKMSNMHDKVFRQTLRSKISEQKFGLILGRFWIKKA